MFRFCVTNFVVSFRDTVAAVTSALNLAGAILFVQLLVLMSWLVTIVRNAAGCDVVTLNKNGLLRLLYE